VLYVGQIFLVKPIHVTITKIVERVTCFIVQQQIFIYIYSVSGNDGSKKGTKTPFFRDIILQKGLQVSELYAEKSLSVSFYRKR